MHSGTQNYKTTLDKDVWLLAASEAIKPSPLYTAEFYSRCIYLVQQHFNIDLFRDVNVHNSLSVYLYLIQNV